MESRVAGGYEWRKADTRHVHAKRARLATYDIAPHVYAWRISHYANDRMRYMLHSRISYSAELQSSCYYIKLHSRISNSAEPQSSYIDIKLHSRTPNSTNLNAHPITSNRIPSTRKEFLALKSPCLHAPHPRFTCKKRRVH